MAVTTTRRACVVRVKAGKENRPLKKSQRVLVPD